MKAYLWDPWLTARTQPERMAIYAGDRSCTFGELIDQVGLFRQGIAALGLKDGSVLGTDLPPGPEFFAIALAALRDGYGMFAVSRDLSVRAALLKQAGAVIDITDRSFPRSDVPCMSPVELRDIGAKTAKEISLHGNGETRSGYLVFATSGTTGQPAVVLRSRPWYPYRGVAVLPGYAAGLDKGPHIMAFPTFHLGTLWPALYALQAGSAVVVQHAWSVAGFRELVDRHAADSAFVTAGQLSELVQDAITPRHPIKVIFTGGSPIGREIKRTSIELFGPVVHEFYGTSKGVISEVPAAEWIRHEGTVGRPIRGVRATIRAGKEECRPGKIGNIWVRYRMVDTDGFSSAYEDTGDLGYIDEDGYLFVVSRAMGSGANESAMLEYFVRMLPGVTDTAIIPAHDAVTTCYVEHNRQSATKLKSQIENLAGRLGIPHTNIVIGSPGRFPRTTSGKLRRTHPDTL